MPSLALRVSVASDRGQYSSWLAIAILGLMLAAYDFAYLTTPYELKWHLSTSVDRLLIQLWPIAVLAIFRQLRAPEEVWPIAERGAGFLTCPIPNAAHLTLRRPTPLIQSASEGR